MIAYLLGSAFFFIFCIMAIRENNSQGEYKKKGQLALDVAITICLTISSWHSVWILALTCVGIWIKNKLDNWCDEDL